MQTRYRIQGGKMGWLLLLVLLLSACSGGEQPESTAGPKNNDGQPEQVLQDPVSQTPAPQTPVELTIVSPDTTITPEFLEELADRFPHYTFHHINQSTKGQSLPELIAVNTPIDIYGRAASVFAQDVIGYGLNYDISDLVRQHQIDLKDFDSGLIDFNRVIADGGLYGLPGAATNLVMYYNKDVFDRFGLPYPENGMTWEETMELSAKMTRKEGDVQYYGLLRNVSLMLSLNPFGLPYMDRDTLTPTINTDERWKTIFRTWFTEPTLNRAYTEGGITLNATSRFYDGATAMMIFNGNLGVISGSNLLKLDWDMASLPVFPEAPETGSPVNAVLYGVSAISKHKEEAMEVIRYVTSDENLGKFSRKGFVVGKQTPEIMNTFASEATPADKNWGALIYNRPAPFPEHFPYQAELTAIVVEYAGQLVKGETDLNTALRSAEEEFSLIIREQESQ